MTTDAINLMRQKFINQVSRRSLPLIISLISLKKKYLIEIWHSVFPHLRSNQSKCVS